MITQSIPTVKDIFAANQVLTVEIAQQLVGKTIATTNVEYYMNKPRVNIITVGYIMSDWHDGARRPYPTAAFGTFQEYWSSYMSQQQIDEQKTRLVLFGIDHSRWYVAHTKYWNFYEVPTFTGSDADREVYYVIL